MIPDMALPSAMNATDLIDDEFTSPHSSADEEYESDEPPELKLNLEELKDCASIVASATCTRARKLTRGTYHEIFLLEFDADSETLVEIKRARNSGIARLTRSEESLAKATSELATMRLVKDRTSIPVAKIFHQDLRPNNPVGAPFVLMERLPGEHLYKLWDGLSLDHKKNVETRQHLAEYLSSKSDDPCFSPPFRLIHSDFDAQNLLFVKRRDYPDKSPILSGVIDFEYAYVGPLYYLYEYPIFIQDVDFSPELYEQNAILRPYFVRALRQSFPKGSPEAIAARDVMREKNYLLNNFPRVMEVIKSNIPTTIKRNSLHFFLKGWRDGNGLAYEGRQDYVPDPELESDED